MYPGRVSPHLSNGVWHRQSRPCLPVSLVVKEAASFQAIRTAAGNPTAVIIQKVIPMESHNATRARGPPLRNLPTVI